MKMSSFTPSRLATLIGSAHLQWRDEVTVTNGQQLQKEGCSHRCEGEIIFLPQRNIWVM